MNTLQKFEAKELEKTRGDKKVPTFSPGDTVKVNLKIREGERERIQAYEGICIARAGTGINENFTVRKISYGEGVERVFPLFSPRIESVELVRRGSVRRAKLYYLRDLRGKSARISERTTGHGLDEDTAPETGEEKPSAPKVKKTRPVAEKATNPKAARKKA